MIIIARQREALKSRQVSKDLNSILKEWNWSGVHPKSAQEFLNKFKPWVQDKIKLSKEVEALLERKGVDNLSEL
jgi:hypothetical protein